MFTEYKLVKIETGRTAVLIVCLMTTKVKCYSYLFESLVGITSPFTFFNFLNRLFPIFV